jgi:hypothetical protein
MKLREAIRQAPEATFYCCWCSKRKPVGTGFALMSRKRKKCSACCKRTKETHGKDKPKAAA